MWSRDELAEMPEPFQVRHVDVRAVEVDPPDATLWPKRRALRGLNLRRLPEELGHLLCGRNFARLLRDREALPQELRGRAQVSLLGSHARHREERGRHRALHVTGIVRSRAQQLEAQRTQLAAKLKRPLPEGA